MRKSWIAAAALLALPMTNHAHAPLQYPGLSISAEGGLNWMLNTTINTPSFGALG